MRLSELIKLLNDTKEKYDTNIGGGCDSDPKIDFYIYDEDGTYVSVLKDIDCPYVQPIIEITLMLK